MVYSKYFLEPKILGKLPSKFFRAIKPLSVPSERIKSKALLPVVPMPC